MEGTMNKTIQAGIPALFLHDLVNKLAVIVGHCDLVSDHLKEGSQCAKRVSAVQDIAREMAKELNEYHGQVLEAARSAGTEELDVARANELSVVNHCQWVQSSQFAKNSPEGQRSSGGDHNGQPEE
jgi:hypothetical protein